MPENNIKKHPPIKLRFLDFERKASNITYQKQLILDLPQKAANQLERWKNNNTSIKVMFKLDKETYYFTSTIDSASFIIENIPILILNWPEKLFLQQRRTAQRVTNFIPEELDEKIIYVKDISTKGIGLLIPAQDNDDVSQLKQVTLKVPAIYSSKRLTIDYIPITASLKIKQKSISGKFLLLGCVFQDMTPTTFLLLQKYIKTRQKEVLFYKKNESVQNFV